MEFSLLRAPKPLTKYWLSNGRILPSADQKWFEGKDVQVSSLFDFHHIINAVAKAPRIALVKESIATLGNRRRLRRKCQPGVDEFTGEWIPAGLEVVPRCWIVLDVEKLPRPASIRFDDGARQAEYARSLLPEEFEHTACVWQMSASAGHEERRAEIRLHLFFMLDVAIYPAAFKGFLGGLPYLDRGIFDKSRLIFTSDPIIQGGLDPIKQRHGLLAGKPLVKVARAVLDANAQIRLGSLPEARIEPSACVPTPGIATAFIELVGASGILRSGHAAYGLDRSRRLAFCSLLKRDFAVADEAALADAFREVCVGPSDANGEHDVQEALAWARKPSPTGRSFTAHKLLCDGSAALREAGELDAGRRAARLAMALPRRRPARDQRT